MKNLSDKPVVVYYTNTSFMDVILENIQCIKDRVILHLVIELNPQGKNATIIHIDSLAGLGDFEPAEKVLGPEQWPLFKPYFDGLASVHFAVHQHPKSLSPNSILTAYRVSRHLKKLRPDIIHFDTITQRLVGMIPFLLNKKVVITLHDPVPHTGEHDWKEDLLEFLYFRMARGFVFYSRFAAAEFNRHYPKNRVPVYVTSLQPYTFNQYFLPKQEPEREGILFFGRLSYYKGVDILLDAIPQVLEKFPGERFIIAGKPVFGYEVNKEKLGPSADQVSFISRYLTTGELVELIRKAKFIVCPYREATQSGVLMTSFALGKCVLATNVGSFPQYVDDGKNGILSACDPASLANAICRALQDGYYEQLEKQVNTGLDPVTGKQNGDVLLGAYHRALGLS